MVKNNQYRISALDNIRGLAAFTVVLNHCILTFPTIERLFFSYDVKSASIFEKALVFSPLHLIWNGHAAVILFFILSGFVLSIPHYSARRFKYTDYLIKRTIRLYVPYILIVAIACLCINYQHKNHSLPQFSNWFNEMWSEKISMEDFVKLAKMKGNAHKVDTTIWTIGIELKISLILPLFIFIIKRVSMKQCIVLVLIFLVLYNLLAKTQFIHQYPELATFYYLPFFLLGCVLFKYKDRSIIFFNKNKTFKILVLIMAPFIYNWEWLLVYFISKGSYYYLFALNDYMVASASALFIVLVISFSCSSKSFLITPIRYIGKISFSLYLLHPIIIIIVTYSLFFYVGHLFVILISICLSIVLSFVYYKFIEEPAITLGKQLALVSNKFSFYN